MIDANNGYNLSITKRVLSETRDVGVFWVVRTNVLQCINDNNALMDLILPPLE